MITEASPKYFQLYAQAVDGVQNNLSAALSYFNAAQDAEQREMWRDCVYACLEALDQLSDDFNA